MIRLIKGLYEGKREAVYVLVFAVVGTVILYFTAEYIRRRRKLGK